MRAVTPIGGSEDRSFMDVYDYLGSEIDDIETAANLIAAADGHIDVERMNKAGFMLDRMTRRAQALLKELWELQRRPA